MYETLAGLLSHLDTAVKGRSGVTRLVAACFLAGGHVLLEDVPGTGKTTLAKALAHATGGSMGRIQFTPDLMPTDLTGVNIFHSQRHEFVFHPGPVFATVVIADEINRASPKTQSALLEAMQERHVTVDGTTHPLPQPFTVIATQNPHDMAGTYPLPEAQRDRFMASTQIGYPAAEHELQVLKTGGSTSASASPVMTSAQAHQLIEAAASVHVADRVYEYVLALVRATRKDLAVALGASPRAGLHMVALAKATALLQGRDHVLPDDVQAIAIPALAHRVSLTADASLRGARAQEVLQAILREVPVR